ncbi:MAG TPA: HEAT repeat domain-containing protein, partial [Pyrinomonadaceae bacterium]
MKELLLVVATAIACALGAPLPTNWPEFHNTSSDVSAPQQAGDVTSNIQKLSSNDPLERVTAACSLGELRAQEAIPALVKLLSDNTEVQYSGCSGKNNWKDGSVPKTTPGEMAAVALTQIGSAAVEPLIGAIRSDSPIARANAAFAFGLLRDARTVEPLINATRDIDARVRAKAVWSLGL